MASTEHASVCTLDCPDTCSLHVTVTDGRVSRVRGSHALPYTAGVICNKVAHHTAEWLHGPRRLTHPLKRVGPKGSDEFQRIGWDEALDIVHARISAVMAEHGPQAVAPLNYAGPHGVLASDSMSLRFFHKLGATQLYRGAMCGAVKNEAWLGTYGAAPGIGPDAAEHAALNLVWGNNATVTNLHLARGVLAAKKRGGRLVVVDPLRTRIAEHADLHIAPQPGTDVLLGFALACELEAMGAHDAAFIAANVVGYEEYMALAREWPVARAAEVAAVKPEDLRTLARWMAEASPLVVAPGNGLERGRNGGAGVRAVIALPALLGKFTAQSGVVAGAGRSFPRNPALTRPDLAPQGTRVMNILDVGRHLTGDDVAPPLRALVIYNHNPVVVHPDQNRMRRGLQREDVFALGIEISMTESMRYCDVVLPAATSFEQHDIYASYGHHWLQRAEPVLPPPGEALPNTEIFRRLAARFGFADECFRDDDHALMRQAMKLETLPTPEAAMRMTKDSAPYALFATHRPATPSGKVELMSAVLAQRWGEERRLPRFRARREGPALTLISPASDKRISSTLLGVAEEVRPPLLMHPRDAATRGLAGAQEVRVHNALGSVVLPLLISDAVPPGVVASEKGAWGNSISALASAEDRADLADGACYNDTQVEVERA